MKTKILKSLLNITPIILMAVALMQLYRANMELKYNYESLEWRMKNKSEQLDITDAMLFRRILQFGRKADSSASSNQFPSDHDVVSSKVTK